VKLHFIQMSFFGKVPQSLKQRQTKDQTSPSATSRLPHGVITVKEAAKHSSRSDCWLVINKKAYDVTRWIDKNPGGDIILSYAGMDATGPYDAFHDESTQEILADFYIGDVVDSKTSKASQEHKELSQKLEQEDYFSSSKIYYSYKFLFNVALLLLGIFFVGYLQNIWGLLLGGITVAFFWQQCGWLAHDFLHHQVFKNRMWNNTAGYVVGNIFQGFSVAWWKAKHNLHHAVPNVAGFDPDIDTMPFLAWSEKMFDGNLVGLPKVMVRHQHLFYFPLLSVARLSWAIQSVLYAFKRADAKKIEVFTLMLHYLWYGAIMFYFMNVWQSLFFIFVTQCATGLLLAMAFSLNHNGMDVLDSGSQGSVDFPKLQVITGRDVQGGGLVSWFMGGLDLQIEHHLFPRIPRHKLPSAKKVIRGFCEDNSLEYHQTGFWEGTRELLSRLRTVGSAVS